MLEDKYIGLVLAISGSFAIGTSFIITKKGLTDAGSQNSAYSSEDYGYLRNPTWWAGITTLANFAAYTFAPPILVTPLGALSVLIGAVLASFLLNEKLGRLGRMGCGMCLIGSLIIIIHAPADKEVETVDEILHYASSTRYAMLSYLLLFSLVMIFNVAPRYGRSNPLVYISICSVVGFGVAVKLTLGGNNQFTHPSTYVFGIVVVGCILVQMNFFNKALDTFSTNVVNPMYYVGFSTATIVASLILFQGFNTTDGTNTVTLLLGFIVTFLGHSTLETGLLNPRMSLQGRPSLDGWGATSELGPDGFLLPAGHGRRSSLYRVQSTTLYNAFEEGPRGDGPLSHLRESEEEEDQDAESDGDVDERTRLHSTHNKRPSVPRSHSSSPALQGSARSSPGPPHKPV
ncbi:magnesium transporter NIPA-domain-containing protein [Pisolithus microcarpus]|nr:magnesium transporter NIPA-domain-containing protein [Pisolithus microcarpus]